jgi:hypothetical protein
MNSQLSRKSEEVVQNQLPVSAMVQFDHQEKNKE